MCLLKAKSFGLWVLLLASISSVLLPANADAPSYSVSVGGGSFSPNIISGNATATATLTASLNVKNPNQEIQESGDHWIWSASVTGYKATSQAAFGSVPNGIAPPVVSASSGSATSTITAKSSQATTPVTFPGYYLITVTATDSFTLTDSSTKPATATSQSQSGSTTLQIVVVMVGDMQYNDPQNGWTSFSGTLYGLKGTSLSLKAIPFPADASFPSGYPTWGGSSGASGTGATTTVSLSAQSATTSDFKTITASCGNASSKNVIVFDLVPQAVPTDTSVPNHHPTHIGVGEVINLSYTATPSGLSQSQIGSVTWTMDSGGSMLSTNPYQYQAGPSGGGATFTLKLITGPSANGSRALMETIFAPTLVYQVNYGNDTGTYVYHNNTNPQNLAAGATESVGYLAYYCLSPNDISFANVKIRETDCLPTTATGALSASAGQYHMGGGTTKNTNPPWVPLAFATNSYLNTWIATAYDQVGFGSIPLNYSQYPQTGFGAGQATYQIPFSFHVSNGTVNNSSLIQSVLQSENTDTGGKATISKGSVTVSAAAASSYVGPFPPMTGQLW